MSIPMNKGACRLAVGLAALWLCMGCAGLSLQSSPKPPESKLSVDAMGWWYVRFQSDWPEDQDPEWRNDLLLAREVIGPLLTEYENEILLWRFHRRASRDKNGHQFSFIFYASQNSAERINRVVQSCELVQKLLQNDVLIRVRYNDPIKIRRPDIEDTSDKNWSEPLQQTWPYFIMGVSRSWLELIDRLATQTGGNGMPNNLSDMQARYAEINREINQTWKFEGNHAYIHHLSALFGYQPVLVLEKRLMTF